MVSEDMKPYIAQNWPIVFFGDGYYAQVKRGPVLVDGGKKYRMFVIPEQGIRQRFKEFDEEFSKKGYLDLEYPQEMVRILSMDAASQRFKVFCTIKNERSAEMNDNDELWSMIRYLQKKVEDLTLQLMLKEEDMKLALTDLEGFLKKIKNMQDNIKVAPAGMYMQTGVPSQDPEDH